MTMRQMKIGYYATTTGGHIAGWRHPNAYADHGLNLDRAIEMARLAEAAKLDFLFLADSLTMRGNDWDILSRNSNRYVAQFEPLTLLSALAAATSRIGLIATASTTYEQPYSLARRFASLDLLSRGRAGWNMVTSTNPEEPPNFSMDAVPAHAHRYHRAAEFVEVVKGLWRTWEDDAITLDKRSGRFFDPAKLHLLNHKGEHFQVRGPLNVPRSPQGHPVIVQAGASEPGRDLAAGTAEAVFTTIPDLGRAQAYYRDLKRRAAGKGRRPEDLLVLPGVKVFVGATEAEARAKHEAVEALIDPVVGRSMLEMFLQASLGDAPDDGPLPPLPPQPAGHGGTTSTMEKLLAEARTGITIRELYLRIAGKDSFAVMGTPAQVADQLEERFLGDAADGFILLPAYFPDSLGDFAQLVVPELQRRGLFRTDYQGATLREHFGLPRPQV